MRLLSYGSKRRLKWAGILVALALVFIHGTWWQKTERNNEPSSPKTTLEYSNPMCHIKHKPVLEAPTFHRNAFLLSNYSVLPRMSQCPPSRKFAIIFVNSHAGHRSYRRLIRDTWASHDIQKNLNISVFFLLAKANESVPENSSYVHLQNAVETEAAEYGDILQGDFDEDYRLMARKVIMGFRWLIATHGSSYEYMLKTDDDMYINVMRLLDEVRTVGKARTPAQLDRTIMCATFVNLTVPRNDTDKWYISEQDWGVDTWPTFCPGSMYVMRPQLVREVYTTALDIEQFVWHEDVFLTGIIGQHLNVSFVNWRRYYKHLIELKPAAQILAVKRRGLIFAHIHSEEVLRKLWREVALASTLRMEPWLVITICIVGVVLCFWCIMLIAILAC